MEVVRLMRLEVGSLKEGRAAEGVLSHLKAILQKPGHRPAILIDFCSRRGNFPTLRTALIFHGGE
jgi:hypothetical protein